MIREIGHIFHLPRNYSLNKDQLSISVNNCSLDFPQHLPKPPDLLHWVVMHWSHPHHAAGILQS